jgi:hypothetical protein
MNRSLTKTGVRLPANLLLITPILVSVVVLAPRLLSPQFGLLDDGNTLVVARGVIAGDWRALFDFQIDRLRPVYWLFPTAVYAVFGANPLGFFLANALVFAGATGGLVALVRQEGGSCMQAWLTGMLFALATPAVEAFYTLSKAEGLQVLLFVVALVLAGASARCRSRGGRAALLAAAAGAAALAHLTKETSLVMLPVSAAWVLMARFGKREPRNLETLRRRAVFLAANLVALPIGFLVWQRLAAARAAGPSYALAVSLAIPNLVSSATRWAGWLVRDFPYLMPLVLWFGVTQWRRRPRAEAPLLSEGLIWIAGWVAVYLPWVFTDEYYLLPCAVGCALFAGAVLDRALRSLNPTGQRGLAAVCLLLTTAGVLVTLPNNVTAGRIQLAVDETNAAMLDFIGAEAPTDSVVLVNLQEHREYFDQIGLYLREVMDRGDLHVVAFRPESWPDAASSREQALVVSPIRSGSPYFTVRLGVGEVDARRWEASLEESLGSRAAWVYHEERRLAWVCINLQAFVCPVFPGKAYCTEPRPVIEAGDFIAGWMVARVGALPFSAE